MSKFTKGKWEYCEPLGVVFSEDTCAVIATVHGAGTGSCFCLTPEGQANACLIAAAPEMYELLMDYPADPAEQIAWLIRRHSMLARIDGKEESHG